MGIADGKRALIVGVANDKSLAWSIAQELHAQGAEVALTFQGEILEKRVRPLAQEIGAQVVGELDVTSDSKSPRSLRTSNKSGADSTCWCMRWRLQSARTCAIASST